METEDNRIPRLGADQALEHGCRSGVGNRGDAGDDSDRFGDLNVTFVFVFVNDADGFLIFDAVPDVFGREDILDILVLDDAAAGFFVSHLGEREVLVKSGEGHRVNHGVDLFLCHRHISLERDFRVGDEPIDHRPDVDGFSFGFISFCFCFSHFL